MRYSFFLGTIDPGSYIGIPSSFRTQGPAGPGSAVKRATLEWGQQEPTEGLSLFFSLKSGRNLLPFRVPLRRGEWRKSARYRDPG